MGTRGILRRVPKLALTLDAPRYERGTRTVVFNYQRPGRGPATLSLFDATDRQLRSWVGVESAPMRGSVRWDGTDDRGVPVGSGIYFARLDWSGQSRSAKVPWLR